MSSSSSNDSISSSTDTTEDDVNDEGSSSVAVIDKSTNTPAPPSEGSSNNANSDDNEALDDLRCPICMDPYVDAVQASCSHKFCDFCIQHWFRSRGSRVCPVCRSEIGTLVPKPELDKVIDGFVSPTTARERAVHRRLHRADDACFANRYIEERILASFEPGIGFRRAASSSSSTRVQASAVQSSRAGGPIILDTRRRGGTSRRQFGNQAQSNGEPGLETDVNNNYVNDNNNNNNNDSRTFSQVSSTSSSSEDLTTRIRRVEELERLTSEFETHLSSAQEAYERLCNAEQELDDHVDHLTELYQRYRNLGVFTARDALLESQSPGMDDFPLLQHGAGFHQNPEDEYDPLSSMYEELDNVIDEAMYTRIRNSDQRQHATPRLSTTEDFRMLRSPTLQPVTHSRENLDLTSWPFHATYYNSETDLNGYFNYDNSYSSYPHSHYPNSDTRHMEETSSFHTTPRSTNRSNFYGVDFDVTHDTSYLSENLPPLPASIDYPMRRNLIRRAEAQAVLDRAEPQRSYAEVVRGGGQESLSQNETGFRNGRRITERDINVHRNNYINELSSRPSGDTLRFGPLPPSPGGPSTVTRRMQEQSSSSNLNSSRNRSRFGREIFPRFPDFGVQHDHQYHSSFEYPISGHSSRTTNSLQFPEDFNRGSDVNSSSSSYRTSYNRVNNSLDEVVRVQPSQSHLNLTARPGHLNLIAPNSNTGLGQDQGASSEQLSENVNNYRFFVQPSQRQTSGSENHGATRHNHQNEQGGMGIIIEHESTIEFDPEPLLLHHQHHHQQCPIRHQHHFEHTHDHHHHDSSGSDSNENVNNGGFFYVHHSETNHDGDHHIGTSEAVVTNDSGTGHANGSSSESRFQVQVEYIAGVPLRVFRENRESGEIQ